MLENSRLKYVFTGIGLLLLYAVIQAAAITRLPLTYAQGTNLLVAGLMHRGYSPYEQIFTLEAPLFVALLGLVEYWGLTLVWAKTVFALFGLLLLVSTFLIAKQWLGTNVAFISVFLLATSSTFITNAGSVIPVLPALSIGSLGLVVVTYAGQRDNAVWHFLGGTLLGVALWLSFLVWSLIVTGILFCIFDRTGEASVSIKKPVVKSVGPYLAGLISTLAIGLLLATPQVMFEHLFANTLTLTRNLPLTLAENLTLIGHFAFYNGWLAIFTLIGLGQIYQQADHPAWLMVLWFGVGAIGILFSRTAQLADVDVLLPPLTILAAWGVWFVVKQGLHLISPMHDNRLRRGALIAAMLLSAAVFIIVSQELLREAVLRDIDNPDYFAQLQQREELVKIIQRVTDPDTCVVTDDAALAALAERFPPPELVGLTADRINGGLITPAEIGALLESNQCSAVVASSRLYTNHLTELMAWAESYYPYQEDFLRTRIYYQ